MRALQEEAEAQLVNPPRPTREQDAEQVDDDDEDEDEGGGYHEETPLFEQEEVGQ